MKKLSPTLIASVAIVAALVGAGGALITRDSAEPNRVTDLTIRTADESSIAPAPAPEHVPEHVPATPEESPVSETAPELKNAPPPKAPTRSTPTAPKPADDPAQGRAEAPAPEPVAEPTAEPDPAPKAECREGDTEVISRRGSNSLDGGESGIRECIGGKWVVTKEPVDAPSSVPADPTSPPSE